MTRFEEILWATATNPRLLRGDEVGRYPDRFAAMISFEKTHLALADSPVVYEEYFRSLRHEVSFAVLDNLGHAGRVVFYGSLRVISESLFGSEDRGIAATWKTKVAVLSKSNVRTRRWSGCLRRNCSRYLRLRCRRRWRFRGGE